MEEYESRDLGGGKKLYADYYHLAKRVVGAHREALGKVPALGSIAFIRDEENTPKRKGKPLQIRAKEIQGDVTALAGFDWMVTIYIQNLHRDDQNFLQLLMYDAFRAFDQGEKSEQPYLQDHDIREWTEVYRLKPNWRTTANEGLPDICADGFYFPGQTVQQRLPVDNHRDSGHGERVIAAN